MRDQPMAGAEGALPLAEWGVIRASGEDARSFLHGQLSQDITGLSDSEARLAGYCSAKGRLLATFVVWPGEGSTLLLACSADLLAATLKRLSMFVLRAKCNLADATAELPLWGLAGQRAQAWLGAAGAGAPWSLTHQGQAAVVRLPDGVADGKAVPRYLWVAPASAAPPDLPPLEAEAWRWLEAGSGVVRICAATGERFVPQAVNLDLVGGVNFQKGCYPGQEVVARSQYRGSLKRRGFVVDSMAPLHPGQELFHSDDPAQPAGAVVLAGAAMGSWRGFAELKLAAAGRGTLHAGSAEGPPLTFADTPYPVPAEAA
jgi:hypothetical protein